MSAMALAGGRERVPAVSRSRSSLASSDGSVPPMLSEKCAWQ
jgi:hypothetical protein